MKKMSSKKEVLLLSPFFRPNVGGVETHLSDLVEYSSKNGIFMHVLTYQPLTKKEKGEKLEKGKNYKIRRLNWFGYNLFYKLENYPFLEFLYLFPGLFFYSFFYLLFNRNIRVVYGNGMVANFMAAILSKIFNKKAVTSIHTYYRLSEKNSTYNKISGISKWIFNNSDVIFVLMKSAKQDLIDIGVESSKIFVINYWTDTKTFSSMNKKNIRKEYGINGDFVALFVARFVDIKGVDLIAEVAKNAPEDMTFVFVGDGPKKSVVEKVSKKKNVYYLGFRALEEMPKIFNIGNFLLWGSIDEDFVGITTRNALSCGLPIISSKEAIFFDVKKETDENVFPKGIFHIVEPNSSKIIKLLNKLKKDKSSLQSYGKKARKYCLDRYGTKNAELFHNKLVELCV